MITKRPRKLSTILSIYFLVSIMLLGGALLYWTYYSATNLVRTELNKSFEQNHRIVEELVEREGERLDSAIHELQLNNSLLTKIAQESTAQAQKIFQEYMDKHARQKLDVMFITTSDKFVLLNASSPLPDVNPILPQLAAASRKFLFYPQLAVFRSAGICYAGIFKSSKLILESGEVFGVVVTGVLFNDNLRLMSRIKTKSKLFGVLLACDQDEVISSTGISSQIINEISVGSSGFQYSQPDGFHRLEEHSLIWERYFISLRGNKGPVSIFLVQKDDVFAGVQKTYLHALYSISVVCIILLFLTLYMIRRLIYPAMTSVLEYTDKITRGEMDALFVSELVVEFNTLGRAMESMVRAIKHVQDRLLEKENILSSTLNSTLDGVLVVDKDGKVLTSNHRFADMWGIPEPLIEAGNDKGLLESILNQLEDPDGFIGCVEALYNSLEESLDEVRFKDGRVFERYSCVLVHEEHKGRVWNFRDISERKKAEKELQRTRNYLSNIIDSMPSMLVGVDNDGMVTQWNAEAELQIGIAADRAIGQQLDKIIPRLKIESDKITEAIKSQQLQIILKHIHDDDSEKKFENITIYPLVTDGVEGAVIRIDDVTDQVRMEGMMIQSEKMLSVGGLAAGMAHEINNPLGGIIQTANVIQNRLSDLEMPANLRAAEEAGASMEVISKFMRSRNIPEMLERIINSGQRAAKIVQDMLSFARKEDGVMACHDFVQILEKCLELSTLDYDLKNKYDFKQIKIIKEYDKNLPLVLCEVSKIQQVVMNIFKNGAEAMQESQLESPSFVLRLAHEEESGMLRIEIEDNGPGMQEDIRKRIFEPFFTSKPTGRGTGLGLSVSYFIITENHGGEMLVESQAGKGTKFIIRLPVKRNC